jgi:multidrug efflux pump subunit AcrB
MADNLMADEAREGVVSWGAFVGEGAPRFVLAYNPEPPTPDYAMLLVNATSAEYIASTLIPDLESFIANTFPEVNATVRLLPNGAPAWPPVAIRVSGRDSDVIFGFVDTIRSKLETVAGARQVSDDWGPRSKKVAVQIDDTRARLAGVSHQDIAISLQTYLTGIEATEFRENDKLIPIILRSNVENRLDMSRLPGVTVYSQATGRSVPLSQVADAQLTWQPSLIKRRNRLRTVTVESLLAPGTTAAEVNAEMQPWLEAQAASWPFGYSWEFGGEAETSGKANQAIEAKVPIGLVIILLLLVWQFNSFRLPVIILMTIPLAMIGVVVGLLLARSYFGFMTLLGVISLSGIVINNAIVLLDRIRIEREENKRSAAEAVIHAAQQRARPILLTATTTIGGLIPLWLGGGPMWEPMAITIIFGLGFSTILTLGVVPVLYSVFFRVSFSDYRSQER